MGRIFSTLSLLGIGLWAGKRLHIGDYLRRKRGPAVTTNEAKTAFSQASEIISSLYKHFLIFDLTYVASGMVLLLVVCYAAFATSMKGVPRGEYTLIVDFLNRAVGLAARHSFVPTTFTIVSYFAGLLTYDLADNFLYYRYDVPSRGIDWSDYEITITRESRSPDEAAVLISKYERVHHFEVVSVSFLATFVISSLIMAAIRKWLLCYFCFMLLVQCLINYYGVAYYKIRFTEMVYEQCKKERPTGDLLQKAVQRQKKLSLLGGLLLLLWSALFYCFQR